MAGKWDYFDAEDWDELEDEDIDELLGKQNRRKKQRQENKERRPVAYWDDSEISEQDESP